MSSSSSSSSNDPQGVEYVHETSPILVKGRPQMLVPIESKPRKFQPTKEDREHKVKPEDERRWKEWAEKCGLNAGNEKTMLLGNFCALKFHVAEILQPGDGPVDCQTQLDYTVFHECDLHDDIVMRSILIPTNRIPLDYEAENFYPSVGGDALPYNTDFAKAQVNELIATGYLYLADVIHRNYLAEGRTFPVYASEIIQLAGKHFPNHPTTLWLRIAPPSIVNSWIQDSFYALPYQEPAYELGGQTVDDMRVGFIIPPYPMSFPNFPNDDPDFEFDPRTLKIIVLADLAYYARKEKRCREKGDVKRAHKFSKTEAIKKIHRVFYNGDAAFWRQFYNIHASLSAVY